MGGGSADPNSATRSGWRAETASNHSYWGIVDMGSNGIRFSITDLSSPTARILPTVYQYRSGISLYDAQYDEDGNHIPIPEEVIDAVIAGFLRFRIFCQDFKVPSENIRVIATEATRAAENSTQFLDKIEKETGLKVDMISKREEGETGAWGVASSFSDMRGLVLDLGGGSTQITWMITEKGHMKTSSKGAFSFPYGAAALTQRLAKIDKNKSEEEAKKGREELREEMKRNFLNAYNELELPNHLIKEAKKNGGYDLYLSGGGFRGWGYILLSLDQRHGHDYPISLINGYTVHREAFEDTKLMKRVAKEADKIFRVSDRRRAQVPAVAFLVNVLAEIIPYGINQAHFCQGGVREGTLFRMLPPEVRAQRPIEVATAPFARPLAHKIARLLHDSLPRSHSALSSLSISDANDGWDEIPSTLTTRRIPASISTQLLRAMGNMIYEHANTFKETSSTAALYSTSTGVLAAIHGASHINRALLALMLEARYEGDLPPREDRFREALRKLLSPAEVWWANYLGAVALVLGHIYPAGTKEEEIGMLCDPNDSATDDDSQYGRGSSNSSPHGNTNPKDEGQSGCAQSSRKKIHKKPHLRLSARFSDTLGDDHNESGLKLIFHLKMRGENRDDPMKVREELENHVKEIKKVGKEKHWVPGRGGKNDEKWGMKVEVEVKATYPDSVCAGIV